MSEDEKYGFKQTLAHKNMPSKALSALGGSFMRSMLHTAHVLLKQASHKCIN